LFRCNINIGTALPNTRPRWFSKAENLVLKCHAGFSSTTDTSLFCFLKVGIPWSS